MSYVMVPIDKPWKPIKYYETERGAKIGVAARNRSYGFAIKLYKYISETERRALDTEVTVHNILSGKPVQIHQSLVGTCCDPSTERYHSM